MADQVKIALGMALLRVPLLADEVDPSKDGVIATAGGIAVLLVQDQQAAAVQGMQQAIKDYPDIPNLRSAYAAMTQPATAAVQPPDAAELAQSAASVCSKHSCGRKPVTRRSAQGLRQPASTIWRKEPWRRAMPEITDAAIRDYQRRLAVASHLGGGLVGPQPDLL